MSYSKKVQEARMSYTFDDFLLTPNASYVEPKDICTNIELGKGIKLNIPVLSAAMDTVTEADLAIAMAQQGGIGVIHRNLSQDRQVEEVKKVKNAEDLTIRDVITISPDSTVTQAEDLMRNELISGLPVVDDNDEIMGIISKRDIRPVLKSEPSTAIKDIMTSDVVTVEEGVSAEEALNVAYENKVERLPVVRNDKLVGIITIKDILNQSQYPNAARDKDGNFLVAAACGPFDLDRAMALDQAGADVISIDCAHAHNMNVVKFTETIKDNIDAELCVGNIATAEAAEDLISMGVDALKVGIGPGSMCTTRIVAGVGVPQLTAISDVADAAADSGIPVIADGGIRYSGDVAKAIGAGADAVMLGNLLAASFEAPGDIVVMNGKQYKKYRGMGSMGAMTSEYDGGADRYFQGQKSKMNHTKYVPEGIEGAVPYRGTIAEILFQLVGGLKSSMGYCGAKDIAAMKEKARFVRITSSGIKESHPHDLLITNESPNYPTLE
jgi:IMP dehydrogenase